MKCGGNVDSMGLSVTKGVGEALLQDTICCLRLQAVKSIQTTIDR